MRRLRQRRGSMKSFQRSYPALIVLAILSEESHYGYELQSIIERRLNGLNIKQGVLYPVIKDLEKRQLITHEWRSSPEGRQRKYLQITVKGCAFFAEECIAMKDFFTFLKPFWEK